MSTATGDHGPFGDLGDTATYFGKSPLCAELVHQANSVYDTARLPDNHVFHLHLQDNSTVFAAKLGRPSPSTTSSTVELIPTRLFVGFQLVRLHYTDKGGEQHVEQP